MTINEIGKQLEEEFALFGNSMDKYEYIIELGKDLPPLNESFKKDEYLVKGCQSKVWLHAQSQDDVVIYTADSNTVITKGIIAILVRALSGQKATDIVESDLSFIEKIGLQNLLTSQRSNGLAAMIKLMKLYAHTFHQKNQLA